MKTSARILSSIGYGIACTALVACGGGGSGGDSGADPAAQQAFEQRDAFMHELGDAQELLNDMAAGSIPLDEAAFRAAVETVATSAPMLLGHFENRTIIAESRTTQAVFDNWEDFTAKSDALVTAATALSEATASGGFAAGSPLVRQVRETCGGCHRPYRGPDPDEQ
jgi:cytochrome c556